MRGSESIRKFLGIAMSLRVESIYIVRRRRVKKKFVFFFSKFFTRPVRGHSGREIFLSPWTREMHITLDEGSTYHPGRVKEFLPT